MPRPTAMARPSSHAVHRFHLSFHFTDSSSFPIFSIFDFTFYAKNAGLCHFWQTSGVIKSAEAVPKGRSGAYSCFMPQRRKRPLCLSPPPCNSPDWRPGASAPRLQPTFSEAYLQWRTFVPAALAALVHPCAYSAVRVGYYPFPSELSPDPKRDLCGGQPHSILGLYLLFFGTIFHVPQISKHIIHEIALSVNNFHRKVKKYTKGAAPGRARLPWLV